MGRSKAVCQQLHARRRALERYGIGFNKAMRRQMLEMIERHQTTLLSKQSARVSLREAVLEGRQVRFVYDRKRKRVVTFLP
jgi:hypothetical protein